MSTTSFTYSTPIGFTATYTPVNTGFTKAAGAVGTVKTIPVGATLGVVNKASIEALFGSGTGKGRLSPIGLDLTNNMTVANCSTEILAAINSQLELDERWSAMSATIDNAFWTAFFDLLEANDPDINSIAVNDTIQFVFDFQAPTNKGLTTTLFKVDMKYVLA